MDNENMEEVITHIIIVDQELEKNPNSGEYNVFNKDYYGMEIQRTVHKLEELCTGKENI